MPTVVVLTGMKNPRVDPEVDTVSDIKYVRLDRRRLIPKDAAANPRHLKSTAPLRRSS